MIECGLTIGKATKKHSQKTAKREQSHVLDALVALTVLASSSSASEASEAQIVVTTASLMQLRRPLPNFPMAFGLRQYVFYIRVSLDYLLLED